MPRDRFPYELAPNDRTCRGCAGTGWVERTTLLVRGARLVGRNCQECDGAGVVNLQDERDVAARLARDFQTIFGRGL